MTADINASSGCSTQLVNGTPDTGFVSPLLYAIAGNAVEYKASFSDITVGNNDDFGFDNGAAFKAGPGYDMASGLGSPRLTGSGGTDGLAFYVCAYVTGAEATERHLPHPELRTGGGGNLGRDHRHGLQVGLDAGGCVG